LRHALQTFSQAIPTARVMPYSARTGAGRDELWQEIRAVTR